MTFKVRIYLGDRDEREVCEILIRVNRTVNGIIQKLSEAIDLAVESNRRKGESK